MEEFKQFTLLYIEDDEGTREINARVLRRILKGFLQPMTDWKGISPTKNKNRISYYVISECPEWTA